MQSLVSYPNRGPWGNPGYPGNCSGYLVRDLIRFYRPRTVADPAEGSGTTRAVCHELNLPYWGADLQTGFDLLSSPLLAEERWRPDLLFFHPPYYKIIRYSGVVWGKAPDQRDLSHENDWQAYLRKLHAMLERCRVALTTTGRLAVLIGDVRDHGCYYSAQAAIYGWYGPAVVEAIIIKAQHHVRSDEKSYTGRFIRIQHEYCLVLRPPSGGAP